MVVSLSKIGDVAVLLLARLTFNAVAHDLAKALTQTLKPRAFSAARDGWAFRPEEGRDFGSLNR